MTMSLICDVENVALADQARTEIVKLIRHTAGVKLNAKKLMRTKREQDQATSAITALNDIADQIASIKYRERPSDVDTLRAAIAKAGGTI